MFEAIIGSFLLCITLLGIVAFCYLIMLKLLIPKSRKDFYILLPCDIKSSDVRKTAYALRMKINLMGEDLHGKVVVLDNGICEKEKDNLLEICRESNGIYLVSKGCLKDFLDGRI
jgi:hypothetical protein